MEDPTASPRKRARLSSQSISATSSRTASSNAKMEIDASKSAAIAAIGGSSEHNVGSGRNEKEIACGIVKFLNEDSLGFSGILKQRYTDFQVNEIMLDGTVAHLTSTEDPESILKQQKIKEAKQVARLEAEHQRLTTDDARSVLKEEIASSTADVPIAVNSEPVETVKEIGQQTEGPGEVQQTASGLTEADVAILEEFFGPETSKSIIKLDGRIRADANAKPNSFGKLFTASIAEKQKRSQIHKEIRRMFDSRLETAAQDDNSIMIWCGRRTNTGKPTPAPYGRAPDPARPQGRIGWAELGGQHLHFSLYKENKDTMECVQFLAKNLQVNARDFSFAGTKDRRAITVQRVSVHRMKANDVKRANKYLYNAQIGDFRYEKHKLNLGDLAGNDFAITLRDCHFPGEEDMSAEDKLKHGTTIVENAFALLCLDGFINYFGLQRFGSHAVGTETVGKLILQGKYEEAVKAIMSWTPAVAEAGREADTNASNDSTYPRDDMVRARVISTWEHNGNTRDALQNLPRKFSAERAIIESLGRKRADWLAALQSITRNLRTMYPHAYQSLVWNQVASERLDRFGKKVIAGDLVLKETQAQQEAAKQEEMDENGEPIIRPAEGDTVTALVDQFERARALSEEEANSGKFDMFDIVLPLPGFDVEYPQNAIGDFYKELMAKDELDPADMRRGAKEFSLSGSYRKLLAKVGDLASFELRHYHDDHEQMVETDLQKCLKNNPKDFKDPENHRAGDVAQDGRGMPRGRGDRGRGGRGGRGDHGRGARGGSGSGRNWRDTRSQNGQEDLATPAIAAAESEAQQLRQKVGETWGALPDQLMAADAQTAIIEEQRRQAELKDPSLKADVTLPEIKEKFIEKDADEGRRTGRIDITIAPSEVITHRSAVESAEKPAVENGAVCGLKRAAEEPLEDVAAHGPANGASTLQSSATRTLQAQGDTKMENGDNDIAALEITKSANESGVVDNDGHISEDRIMPLTTADGGKEQTTQTEPKIAVVVRFQLGPSTYATMALRELMKRGGVKAYKPEFNMN